MKALIPALLTVACSCGGTAPEPCDPSTLEALIVSCELAIAEAPPERSEDIGFGCAAATDAWLSRCKVRP